MALWSCFSTRVNFKTSSRLLPIPFLSCCKKHKHFTLFPSISCYRLSALLPSETTLIYYTGVIYYLLHWPYHIDLMRKKRYNSFENEAAKSCMKTKWSWSQSVTWRVQVPPFCKWVTSQAASIDVYSYTCFSVSITTTSDQPASSLSTNLCGRHWEASELFEMWDRVLLSSYFW